MEEVSPGHPEEMQTTQSHHLVKYPQDIQINHWHKMTPKKLGMHSKTTLSRYGDNFLSYEHDKCHYESQGPKPWLQLMYFPVMETKFTWT